MNSSFGFSIRPLTETQYLQCKRKSLYLKIKEHLPKKEKKGENEEEGNLSMSSSNGIGP